MNADNKKILVNLELDKDVAEFHQNIATARGIPLEERLIQLILEHSPEFKERTKESIDQFFKDAEEIAKKYNIPYVSTEYLDATYEDEDDQEK